MPVQRKTVAWNKGLESERREEVYLPNEMLHTKIGDGKKRETPDRTAPRLTYEGCNGFFKKSFRSP